MLRFGSGGGGAGGSTIIQSGQPQIYYLPQPTNCNCPDCTNLLNGKVEEFFKKVKPIDDKVEEVEKLKKEVEKVKTTNKQRSMKLFELESGLLYKKVSKDYNNCFWKKEDIKIPNTYNFDQFKKNIDGIDLTCIDEKDSKDIEAKQIMEKAINILKKINKNEEITELDMKDMDDISDYNKKNPIATFGKRKRKINKRKSKKKIKNSRKLYL